MAETKRSVNGFCVGQFTETAKFDYFYDLALQKGEGTFFWNEDNSILYILIPADNHPNGCCMSLWHIRPNKNGGGHSWEWDGNIERPTLTPSLHAVGIWHGYMRAGKLVSV